MDTKTEFISTKKSELQVIVPTKKSSAVAEDFEFNKFKV
jgi:hypothetical protein